MTQVPYIGITDFTSADQAAAMRKVLDDEGYQHLLHAGVMMSYKTLYGLDTKWAGVFPPKESLKDIFVQREGVLNVLHYADYDNQSTVDDWMEALEWAGPACETIQLDMPWPDPELLLKLWSRRLSCGLETKFIVQVSERALEEAVFNPTIVARWLLKYRMKSCLNYILFDMSGGKGVPMKANYLLDFIWTTLRTIPDPDINIAIAGGLGPDTMQLAQPIVRDLSREHISISFDAQSKLRPSASAMDPIDWGMAETYLRQAAALLRKHNQV